MSITLSGDILFGYDYTEKINAIKEMRIRSGNDITLNIIKIYVIAIERMTEKGNNDTSITTEGIIQSIEVEVNGIRFTAMRDFTDTESMISQYSINILGAVRLSVNDELILKFITYSENYSNDDFFVTKIITPCFSNTKSVRGFYAENGFFSSVIECVSNYSWNKNEGGYQYIFKNENYGFYENFGLPHNYKYKVSYTVNDGYPFIYKLVSGWGFAYPYRKNDFWKNAVGFVKTEGLWKKCNTMIYDKKASLYKEPDIKTGWEISQKTNSGYPYVVYKEIPFYEEE